MNFFKKSVSVPGIFRGIEESVVEDILHNSQRESFSQGEAILQEGEEPDGKGYIIESGSVDVYVGEQKITSLSTGNIFGEIALLNEEPRSATIMATEDTSCIILSQDRLFEMIENDDNSINKEIIRRMEENLENENTLS